MYEVISIKLKSMKKPILIPQVIVVYVLVTLVTVFPNFVLSMIQDFIKVINKPARLFFLSFTNIIYTIL